MNPIIPWLDPKISIEYFVGSFIVLCIVFLLGIQKMREQGIRKSVLLFLIIEYYFLILASTVLCRDTSDAYRVKLMPFWNYVDIWNKKGYPADIMEVIMNVAMFIPIGFLLSAGRFRLPLNKENLSRNRILKWWHVVIAGCSLSLIIEVLQLITRRGLCETNDVIHNTLGALVGWGLFVLVRKGIRYASTLRSATY